MIGMIFGAVLGLYAAASVLVVAVVGAVLFGTVSLIACGLSARGVVTGIAIGLLLYRYLKTRNA